MMSDTYYGQPNLVPPQFLLQGLFGHLQGQQGQSQPEMPSVRGAAGNAAGNAQNASAAKLAIANFSDVNKRSGKTPPPLP